MKRFFIIGFLVCLIGVVYAREKGGNDKKESKNELSIFLGATTNSDDDIVAMLRFGAAYEFEINKFSISPSLFFDTERDDSPSWVYGLSFGFEL